MSLAFLRASGLARSGATAALSVSCSARKIDVVTLRRYSTIRDFFTQAQGSAGTGQVVGSRLRRPKSCVVSQIEKFHSTSFQRRKHSGNDSVRAPKKDDTDTTSDGYEKPRPTSSNNSIPSASHSESNSEHGTRQSASSTQGQENHSLPYNFENYSRFFRRLALAAPNLHRPTRDDFLRVADGFWQRLRIRFRWFTIRSFRKFNADDISGIITWILMSQTLWILVGTTTFFSVVFAIANSLRLQHFIARGISDYLTSETGITIIFESAIVPKWKDSRISFKNVYISRRPTSYTHRPKKNDGHMAAVGYDVSNHPAYHSVGDDDDEEIILPAEEDTNYTMFDLNVGSIDVTLSLWRWLDGKGLVEDAVVKGVRGVLDRRSVTWDPENPLDPAAFRHPSQPGDFELESLQIEDLLITVYQPGGFRPYTASIFRADIRTFRKGWMFYDFLSAENIVGQFDNCLFSLHKPQSIGRTTEMDLKDGEWARMSRIRIDGVNIDHLQASTTMEGPISWITSGKLDAVLDIKFPRDPEDALPFNAILEEIADAISTTLSTAPDPIRQRIPGQRELAKPALSPPEPAKISESESDTEPKVVIDIDLRFRDVKAAVPIFTNDLSYVNSALIRPIVAFMNANRTLVPIHCRVVKNLSDFEGSWTMWESGLMDEISLKIYDALAYHVSQANINRRIKTVSYWSLQLTANAVLSALRNLVDPVPQRVREAYIRSYNDDVFFNLGEEALAQVQ
ncbi:Mitochondrial distribution and morphology protein 31, mitochondrial precursor [Stygiomarasmius scandens]|uniref:Mitochondrial distribution and morphology protein 31, mitochondrial n=1 Tax=Marasmiellus scandens TaxID=2682957 RepID=A0ABR1K6W2_9AGAR